MVGLSTTTLTLAVDEVPDGSFENFDNTWLCDDNCTLSDVYYITYGPESAYAGWYYAYIFHEAGLYQDLTVPSDATILRFQYQNSPEDEVSPDASFTVSLSDPASGDIYAAEIFTEQSDVWLEGSMAVPAAARGQSVRLALSNDTGFNSIDAMEFVSAADIEEELLASYATVKLRVLSANATPVKNAKVFIKSNGKRVNLINLNTDNTVKKVTTNKKGKTPKFIIAKAVDDNKKVKLCVRKLKITECTNISPAAGAVTKYDFTFDSLKIQANNVK